MRSPFSSADLVEIDEPGQGGQHVGGEEGDGGDRRRRYDARIVGKRRIDQPGDDRKPAIW
jgi:hypothetical protein